MRRIAKDSILTKIVKMLFFHSRPIAPLLLIILILSIINLCMAAEPDDASELKALIEYSDSLLRFGGKADSAISIGNKALEIARERYGESDLTVVQSLRSLGIAYSYKEDDNKAEYYFKLALDICFKIFEEDHIEIAVSLDNLGSIYTKQGKISDAEPMLKKSLEIREKVLGPDHPDVTYSLNNLGFVYWKQGRYSEAEPLYKRAIEVGRNVLGADHDRVATFINNLAIIYREQLKYTEAEKLFKHALKIKEKNLGSDHIGVSMCLNNLGIVYRELERYDEAEKLLKRSILIKENTLGKDHPVGAENNVQLAITYSAQGKYREAEEILLTALNIYKEKIETFNPQVTDCLTELARVHGSLGQYSSSLDYYRRAQESRRDFISYVFSYASEIQKLNYIDMYPLIDNSFLSLVLLDNSTNSKELALEMVLGGKGIVLDVISKETEAAHCSFDSTIIEKHNELNSIGQHIANIILMGMSRYTPDKFKDSLGVLTGRKNILEAELSRSCSSFADKFAQRNISVNDIIDALPDGSVLWEIVRYQPYGFNIIGNTNNKTGPPRYVALQLFSNGKIFTTDLGSAKIIDSLIVQSQKAISQAGEFIIYANEDIAEKNLNKITSQLYNLIFEPLRKNLKSVNRLFISPDGELNMLSYNILPCHDDKYVVENYEISYLSSGRDIVKYHHKEDTKSEDVVIIVDPDYDTESTGRYGSVDSLSTYADLPALLFRGSVSRRECLSSPFCRLPATKKEGVIIEDLLRKSDYKDSKLFCGSDACEGVLSHLNSPPRILHIATHGYFCSESNFFSGVSAYDNPLIYSGLAFAGANRRIIGNNKQIPPENEMDGILTSLEVSGLNLIGTELVVLSACRTGMGRIKSGEGVFGLRRSFQHAGAGTIIMSLWDVPEKETAQLMEYFYQDWLSGETKSGALRKSALKVLKDRQSNQKSTFPMYWGGFILAGDPQK
ncbi:MAG: CHAT domain-containing protein [candidate division Zixibacteria bacterium]|nr:CHAT domain-containing protein [candidate division Zixibacteria bacterium]